MRRDPDSFKRERSHLCTMQRIDRMKRPLLSLSIVLVVACGAPRIDTPKPDRAIVARVEHGLVPEIRVQGERAGWSIEERLRTHHTPGVSIAVIHDHRVVWAKAYGVADVSTGAPLGETTLMQAASVSKLFTAVAALRAVDAGKLSIDTDINQSLKSWHLPENELTRATPVTLKHLLSHTAGTNVRSFLGYVAGERVPGTPEILEGQPPANTGAVRVDAPPGAKFRYSGGGTTIVQQALIDVDGRPFDAVMRDLVIGPLGLARSTFAAPAPPLAAGHDYDGTILPDKFRTYPELAAAGLWSTPSDIARLLIEVQLALEGRSKIFSKTLATRLTTPIAKTGEDDTISTSMGAFVERHGEAVYFGHDGWADGFFTMARASKTGGYGAVVMTNGLGGTPILLEVMRSIAAAYGWEGWLAPPIPPKTVDVARFVGRYRKGTDGSIRVQVHEGKLLVVMPFADTFELLPTGEDTFVSRADGVTFSFRKDAAGIDTVIRSPPPWPPSTARETLVRLTDDTVEPLQALEYARLDVAIPAYEKLLAANPDDPSVSVARFAALGADLLDRQLVATRALDVFRVNVALHPTSTRANADLAEGLFRAGHPVEAAAALEKAEALLARDTTLGEFERLYVRWRLQKVKRRGLAK